MTEWVKQEQRVCKVCNYAKHVTPGFGSNFFNPQPCPSCGENHWKNRIYTSREVFTGRWYLPWTWLNYRTEVKHEFEHEPWR